jgi:hypothetical protein
MQGVCKRGNYKSHRIFGVTAGIRIGHHLHKSRKRHPMLGLWWKISLRRLSAVSIILAMLHARVPLILSCSYAALARQSALHYKRLSSNQMPHRLQQASHFKHITLFARHRHSTSSTTQQQNIWTSVRCRMPHMRFLLLHAFTAYYPYKLLHPLGLVSRK